MWNLKLFLVCLFTMIADIVGGVLGIEADKALQKGTHVCPPEKAGPAYKLGVASAVLLGPGLVAAKRSKPRTLSDSAKSSPIMKVATATFWLSWAIGVLAMVFLGIGVSNDDPGSRVPCSFSKFHFLTVGGVLCFIDGVVCVINQVSSASANAE
ncbi:Modifying wall lignin-1/2 protein [Dioscorea alata]|uniref:Modifying wall lignin-1/2 protein n=1 Tax=Dioscorea alata TaxID=55571 RepID=A0ACB7VNV2_DIOAL|nr:Modifying wall lignin-1/2 protein [Dioscorea alata]